MDEPDAVHPSVAAGFDRPDHTSVFRIGTRAHRVTIRGRGAPYFVNIFDPRKGAEKGCGKASASHDWIGQNFLGGASDGEPQDAFHESPVALNDDARQIFSLNTCVACLSTETGTNFFHSFPRNAGFETFLSGFLAGITIADPVSGAPR